MPARFEELRSEVDVSRVAVQTVFDTVDAIRHTCDAGGDAYADHVHPYSHVLVQYASGAFALYWLLRQAASLLTYKSLGTPRALRRGPVPDGAH